MTFELLLAKLWCREPGGIDHANDVEGREKVYRENLLEHGQITMMPLGCPHTIEGATESMLSINYSPVQLCNVAVTVNSIASHVMLSY